jgi:hypothetical protein
MIHDSWYNAKNKQRIILIKIKSLQLNAAPSDVFSLIYRLGSSRLLTLVTQAILHLATKQQSGYNRFMHYALYGAVVTVVGKTK